MSTQIAVRLPDYLVEFIDGRIAEGGARSRAAVVARAVERERRRAVAEHDAVILARSEDADEFSDLADHVVGLALDNLD